MKHDLSDHQSSVQLNELFTLGIKIFPFICKSLPSSLLGRTWHALNPAASPFCSLCIDPKTCKRYQPRELPRVAWKTTSTKKNFYPKLQKGLWRILRVATQKAFNQLWTCQEAEVMGFFSGKENHAINIIFKAKQWKFFRYDASENKKLILATYTTLKTVLCIAGVEIFSLHDFQKSIYFHNYIASNYIARRKYMILCLPAQKLFGLQERSTSVIARN